MADGTNAGNVAADRKNDGGNNDRNDWRTVVPILGGWVKFGVMLWGLGAISLAL